MIFFIIPKYLHTICWYSFFFCLKPNQYHSLWQSYLQYSNCIVDIDSRDEDDKQSPQSIGDNDDDKSVMMPWTIKFDEPKYKDYDKRKT